MDEVTRVRAYALLDEAVAEHKSYAAVATMLGLSRAAVSTVARRCYPGNDAKVLRRVIEYFSRHHCPHLRDMVSADDCRRHGFGKAPTHNPMKMDHWRVCQGCPNKPPR